MARFAAALARVRTEAGFTTAYAFFHKNGGRKVFPCTFPYYLRIERGLALPRPEWLPIFMALLRIPPTDALWRQFTVDYLRDHFGTEEAFASAVAPLLRPPEASGQQQQQTVRRLVSERAYHLTPEQFKTVISDDAAYWCFECLVNERGALTPAELARGTGVDEAKIKAGLKRLSRAKLAKAVGGGRWKSPISGMFYVFPQAYPGHEPDRLKRHAILDRMTSRKGKWLFHANVALRADESSMRRSVGSFTDAMQGVSAYCVYEKGEDTGLYQVETRIRRLLPF